MQTIVIGVWAWLIVTTLIKYNAFGMVAALNYFLPGLLVVIVIHGAAWLWNKLSRRNKTDK